MFSKFYVGFVFFLVVVGVIIVEAVVVAGNCDLFACIVCRYCFVRLTDCWLVLLEDQIILRFN